MVWEGQAKAGGVEGLAGKEEGGGGGGSPAVGDLAEVPLRVGAVELVANDGVPGMVQMDPDLVHPPGVGDGFDEGEGSGRVARGGGMEETLADAEVGGGGGAKRVNSLHQVDGGGFEIAASAQGGVDGPGVLGRPTGDEGEVLLADFAAHHRFGNGAGGRGIFGDEDQAAGFAVEAVDNGEGGAVGEVVSEEGAEAVPQGGGAARFGGVNLEGRGFVDHDPIRALVDYNEVEDIGGGRGHGAGEGEAARRKRRRRSASGGWGSHQCGFPSPWRARAAA